MNFGNSEMWWLLSYVPALGVLARVAYKYRQERLKKFADVQLLEIILPKDYQPKRAFVFHLVFLIAAGILLTCAAFRPRWGFAWKDSVRKGADIAVAIDMSASMLAADVEPNRFERARREVLDFLSGLRGDRLALISFAATPYIESPLTLDYAAFRKFLGDLEMSFVALQGSNIQAALEKSIEVLTKSSDPKRGKAVFLLTDGEEFDGQMTDTLDRLKDTGIRLFILGIGNPEGAPISTSGGYKKDRDGRVVITRLEEAYLSKLAIQSGGIYVRSNPSDDDVKTIYEDGIKRTLEESTISAGSTKNWHEYYQLPLFLACLLILLGPWSRFGQRFFAIKLFFIGLLLLVNKNYSVAQSPERLATRAKAAYEKGDFQQSLKDFEQASNAKVEDPRYVLGKASSEYRLGNFEEAKIYFLEAAGKTKDSKDKAAALYNAGNSQVFLKDYAGAIKTYQDSLSLQPEDQEAKDNLDYAKKLLEEEKKQKEEKDKQEKQQKSEEQQEKDSSSSDNKNSEEEQQNRSDSEDNKQEPDSQNQAQDEKDQQEQGRDKKSSESEVNKEKEESTGSMPKEGGDRELQVLENLADSISEGEISRQKFRAEQANRELRSQSRPRPVKDW